MTQENDGLLTFDEFSLKHVGVKGMKWGRRKSRSGSTNTSADAARYNKIRARVKKNGLDNLSNDDIAKLNKRSQLLAEYKRNNPSKVQQGYTAVKKAVDVLKTTKQVINVGSDIAKSPAGQLGAKLVTDVLKDLR